MIRSLDAYVGALGDRPVVAIVTGIGGVLAADAVSRLVEAIDIEHLVVVGIAGAVDDEIPIGTVVLPEVVVDASSGVSFRPSQFSGSNPSGTLWTTNELITDLEVISGLRRDGVMALDMETATIAEICRRRNIRWSVVRAISDRATQVSLDDEVFKLVNPNGSFNIKRVGAFILKHPRRLPALTRLAKDAKLASERAAEAALKALSQPERKPDA